MTAIDLWVDLAIVAYFLGLNLTYGVYLLLSAVELWRTQAVRMPELDALTLAEESTPPVSIIAPAFNEEETIVHSVRALLQQEYPHFQVIVVNDGSSDRTLDLLRSRFDLAPVDQVFRRDIPSKDIKVIYHSRIDDRLWVVDKENGGKADALNVGLNVCRTPLVCCVDADSLIDRRALLRLVAPFAYGTGHVVAAGGTIRLANGTVVKDGVIRSVDIPRSWLARFQIIEYLRAFLFARLGLNRLGGNLIISGALGLFSREDVVKVGGYRDDTVGEDMELVVRIHRQMRETKTPYEITFIPDPVCYTEAPESVRVLGRQRDRWQRGLMDSLWRHRHMFLNPRYGLIGLVSFPTFVLFELLGPVVELFGYGWFAAAIVTGRVDGAAALLFFVVAFLLGLLLSFQALILDDLSFKPYQGVRSRVLLVVAAALENFGYRQIILFYRFAGMVKHLLGKRSWGTMKRKGFESREAAGTA